MAEKAKLKRVFQVAKELKVVTPTIIEFLESQGYEVNRQQMEPVTDEMYIELLRMYDKAKFLKLQSEQVTEAGDDKKRDAEKLREDELDKIFAAKEVKKLELPQFRMTVVEGVEKPEDVEPVGAEEKEAEAAVAEEKAAKRKPAAKRGKRAVEPEIVGIGEDEAAVASAEEIVEEVEAKETVARRKVELPSAEHLRIVKAAPEKEKVRKEPEVAKEDKEELKKQPARRKLRRKRVALKDETRPEASDREAETKLRKVTEKLERQRTQGKKPGAVSVGQPARKRKKRRRSIQPETVGVTVAKGRGRRRRKIDEKEVVATIKQTFAQMSSTGKKHKRHIRDIDREGETVEPAPMKVNEFITTLELSNLMEVPVQDLIRQGLGMGMIISINQRIDKDTIELLSSEFGFDVEFVQDDEIEIAAEEISGENLTRSQAVVTVMGHVDHGKTTLLDFLRRTKVAESEAGGITQHIGAYEITCNDSRITFLDTPGHEAFTAMRARGAQVTDIVVLVVAADDRVMPQTIEAIDHARIAGVPIIIAVNKIDKPSVDTEAIYKQLADNNILVEKWGGKYQSVEISAKFGDGVDDLLEEILVAADILDIKADATVKARGVVIESRLDRGLGAVATVLIKNGTLKIGEPFVIGQHYGHVRAMYDEFGKTRDEAGPATPVQVVGFDGVPQAGDRMVVYSSEKEAREISHKRQRQYREMSLRQIKALSLEQVSRHLKEMDLRELPLIIKGDVHGSVEVLSDALMKLSTPEVGVQIIHRSVGGISESDVLLAAASKAIIIGFHVHPNPQARETARREGVEYRLYRVIHEVVDDVRKSLEGLLTPTHEEVLTGSIEVRKVYKISRIGKIAGCYVAEGKIIRSNKVRLIRDDVELWRGDLDSLKRFKDDAREVVSGFECGLSLNGFNDIREGDRVEAYKIVETARKLEETV